MTAHSAVFCLILVRFKIDAHFVVLMFHAAERFRCLVLLSFHEACGFETTCSKTNIFNERNHLSTQNDVVGKNADNRHHTIRRKTITKENPRNICSLSVFVCVSVSFAPTTPNLKTLNAFNGTVFNSNNANNYSNYFSLNI